MKEKFTGTSYWEDMTDTWDSITYPPPWNTSISLTEASSLSRTWTEASSLARSYSDVRAAALSKGTASSVTFTDLGSSVSTTYTEL